jgi:hypothetical protein
LAVPEPLVLPEFRPTLPDLARARFGWRERTTIAALVALVALAAIALVVVRPRVDRYTQYVHHGAPATFNLVYDKTRLHRVAPQGAEIVRLEGRRGRLRVAIAVAPLRLPPAQGDVAHGLLPAFASHHVADLRARLDPFQLRQEGRARVNGAPGYEVRFATGPAGRKTIGNDLMILPTEEDAAGALLVTARRTISGRPKLGARETPLDNAAAKAYRSFKYGTATK